jgi:hypothetical protein
MKTKTKIIDNVEYELETHDFNKKLSDIKIPKGWRLWKPSECYKLYENEEYRKATEEMKKMSKTKKIFEIPDGTYRSNECPKTSLHVKNTKWCGMPPTKPKHNLTMSKTKTNHSQQKNANLNLSAEKQGQTGCLSDSHSKEPKFCKDCKWCDIEDDPRFAKCRYVKPEEAEICVVTGKKIIKDQAYYCSTERTTSCGPSANNFEEKSKKSPMFKPIKKPWWRKK